MPSLQTILGPFGSRLTPPLIKIDDKIVHRLSREPQGRRLPGYERELLPLDQALAEVAVASARPPEQFGGVTLAVMVPTRDDVDRWLDVARQAGASKILAPEERAWGGRSGYFFDPEGHAWEVAWSPRARFDARGALLPFA